MCIILSTVDLCSFAENKFAAKFLYRKIFLLQTLHKARGENSITAKTPYGKFSMRKSFFTAKIPYRKISLPQIFISAICPYDKIPSRQYSLRRSFFAPLRTNPKGTILKEFQRAYITHIWDLTARTGCSKQVQGSTLRVLRELMLR